MSRGPDVATRLERALVQAANAAGIEATVTAADWTRWASATFSGARHRLTLNASPSASLDAWLAELPEFEFNLPGHLVADLIANPAKCGGEQAAIEIEVLTVEER